MTSGIPLKRLNINDTDEVVLSQCIICQEETAEGTVSSENGRKNIESAAAIRKDIVYKRLSTVDRESIVYHVRHNCYKQYTLKIKLLNLQGSSPSNADQTGKRNSRSLSKTRAPPSTGEIDIWKHQCVICTCAKHNKEYKKFRISENERAEMFLDAAIYFQDDVYLRICDLQDASAIFGSDIYCHKNCIRSYLLNYERALAKQEQEPHPVKNVVFRKVLESIMDELKEGKGFALNDLRERCNGMLGDTDSLFRNREVRLFLMQHFKDKICLSTPEESNKSCMAFLSDITKEQLADTIRNQTRDPIQESAKIIRDSLLVQDFDLNDKFCDANDLEEAWNNMTIPEPLVTFFSVVFNFDMQHFNNTLCQRLDAADVQEEDDAECDNEI